MNILFQCNNSICNSHKHKHQFLVIESCPECNQALTPNWGKVNAKFEDVAANFPIQIARPVYELCASKSYYKKLHLISDALMGILRLNGGLLKVIKKKQKKHYLFIT